MHGSLARAAMNEVLFEGVAQRRLEHARRVGIDVIDELARLGLRHFHARLAWLRWEENEHAQFFPCSPLASMMKPPFSSRHIGNGVPQ